MIDKLQQDLKQAQLLRDETKVLTLRLLLSEIKNAEIQKSEALSDAEVIVAIQKEAKKRKEAALGFRSGGREESAQQEESELKILEGYLPKQLPTEELTKLVEDSITEIGATSIQDMGKVMGVVMGKIAGRADGGEISVLVKERLSKL